MNTKNKNNDCTVSEYNAFYAIIIISLIIASLCLSVSLGITFKSFCEHQTAYNENIKSSKILRESYDNLTTQFRRFIISRRADGLDAYFAEFDSGRRDAAIQALSKGTEGGELLSNSLSNANEITDMEIHAMALAAKASNLNFDSLRSEIKDYPFTSAEKGMSQIELVNKASSIAFGDEFGAMSERVDSIIDQYTSTLLIENAEEVKHIKNSLAIHIFATLFCLVSLMVMAFVIFTAQKKRVVKPLTTIYNQLINNELLSEDIGIEEIRRIATEYNSKMDELQCSHSVEASYQRALMADSEAVYELNVSKDLITEIICEKEYQPLSSLLNSLELSIPCSFNAYTQAVAKSIPNPEKSVFPTLSCANMLKEYKSGTRSSFSDYEIKLFGVTKKVRSLALYREDPKTRDVIAMILIKDYASKEW